MAARSLICGGVLIAGLMGCAGPKALAPVVCNGGRCDIDVHVENCVITAPDIDNTGANNIFWNIDAASRRAGYKYPAVAVHLGVWLKDPPPSGCIAPGNVFDSPDRQNDGKFKLHNNGNRGTYCYGVQVVNPTTAPPQTCTLDPQIINR